MTQNRPEKRQLSLAHHAVLAGTLPALVHRANNCLSVIAGTVEMAKLDAEDRSILAEECTVLKTLLHHLASQSRDDLQDVGIIELQHLLSELVLVVGTIGRFARCEVDLRLFVTAATVQGDCARLSRLLFSLCNERLAALSDSGKDAKLRIRLSVRRDRARLMITDTGGELRGDLAHRQAFQAGMEDLGRTWEFELSSRVLGSAHAYLLTVPVLSVSKPTLPPRSQTAGRILLLQPAGFDADLNKAVLVEKGYRVERRDSIDTSEAAHVFDLVLCDEESLATLPPSTPSVLVLGEEAAGEGWEFGAIAKPIKPQVLLERVGQAMGKD